MKLRAILPVIILLTCQAVMAQVDEEGNPHEVHQLIISASPSGFADVFNVPAGDDIEGDFHTSPAFEPAGGECWVAHRTTNNISIVDVSEGVLKKTIPTCEMPMDIAFSDDFGLVACFGSDEVEVWDWKEDTLVTTIQTVGQPARIEISADGSTAAVSLELIDEALIIDLTDFSTSRVDNFTTAISGFSFITSNTRNLLNFNGFAISPDGSTLVNGTGGSLKFYDLSSGTVDSIPGIQNAIRVKYTEDGSKLVAVVFGSTPGVYQVDPSDLTVIGQIFPDGNVNSFYGEMAMTPDGDRVLLPATNAGWLIRFDQGDFLPINTSSAVFWTDIQKDGQYGIAGGFNTHLVDMSTGMIVSTTTGISLNTGAISPSGGEMLAMDPLRRERAEMYIIGGGIFGAGPLQLGSELEGDATYSAQFSHDGSKIYSVNALSGTISVIDAKTKSLDGIVVLDNYEIFHIDITADDRHAFVGERLADQVSVIDLDALEVSKVVYGGGNRPDQTFVHPSGEKVYVLNAGGADAIGVIDIATGDPRFVKSFPSGNTGISWTNRGIRCNLAITPDGSRGVLATPFDDEIQILDLVNDEIILSIPAEGFALQTALSTPLNGRVYAAVTLKNSGEVFIIEDILGTPVPFGALPVGSNPTRIAFDPATERFAVCSQDENKIDYIDPLNFEVVETQRFATYLTPLSVRYADDGREFVLLQSNEPTFPNIMQVEDDIYELGIAPGHYFDISPDGNMAAVASIHEDVVYVIDLSTTSNRSVSRVPASGHFEVGPNPSGGEVWIRRIDDHLTTAVDLNVFNASGQLVSSDRINGQETLLDLSDVPSGMLELVFLDDGQIIQRSRLLIH